MIAHRLRHRIDIQDQTLTQDPNTGAMTTTWTDFYVNVPAEVLTGFGREQIVSDAKIASTDARINMRWMPGLEPTMRILWDGRAYNILTMETDITGRKEWRLRCQEGLTDGS